MIAGLQETVKSHKPLLRMSFQSVFRTSTAAAADLSLTLPPHCCACSIFGRTETWDKYSPCLYYKACNFILQIHGSQYAADSNHPRSCSTRIFNSRYTKYIRVTKMGIHAIYYYNIIGDGILLSELLYMRFGGLSDEPNAKIPVAIISKLYIHIGITAERIKCNIR